MLQVHLIRNSPPAASNGRLKRDPSIEEEPLPAIVDTVGDTDMEVDEHAEAREAQDRQREQRRGRDDRELRYPTGPRHAGVDDRRAEPRREQPYPDRRYGGYAGGGDRRFAGAGGRGGYRSEGRMYSDGMRRGGGQGQGYRS